MPLGLALPRHEILAEGSIAATFVVPAEGGCNLKCSFCAIRARGEALGESVLEPDDYIAFLKALASREHVALVALQGYEPLLPSAWGYSRRLLEAARVMGIRTTMVTNGTHLAERARELADLGIGSVTVSLDSAVPAVHDRIRGVAGAFERTVAGIREAVSSGLVDRLVVASVLQVGKGALLDGLPALLRSLGVSEWAVTPLVRFGEADGGAVASPEVIQFDGRRLSRLASGQGIHMTLDDELDAVAGAESFAGVEVRKVKRVDQIVRLSPTGVVSRGLSILRKADWGSDRWRPEEESASEALDRLGAVRESAMSELAR